MTRDKSSSSCLYAQLKITDEHWLTFTIALSLSRGTRAQRRSARLRDPNNCLESQNIQSFISPEVFPPPSSPPPPP